MDALLDEIQAASPAVTVIAVIGALVVTKMALQLLVSFYQYTLRPSKKLKKLGEWAVVTGATDGIGKAYAFALAKQGLNIILISRTESKLKEVQEEISSKYANVTVKYIVCDYSKFDQVGVRTKVSKELAKLDVGVLVNNVGMGYRYPRYFDELHDDEIKSLMSLNIDSTVWMTRMVLPGMLNRKRGAIVNLSSGSALVTLPLLAHYAACKSFVEKFSRALNAEYRSKGVTCQCQVPFYVATKLAKMRRSFSVPTPEEYVRMAIRWVGYPDALVQPFWVHAMMGYVMQNLPDYVVATIISKMHLATRKRGLKKDARLAAEGKKK